MEDMYSLEGVDGNIFAVMGYTARALKQTGHRDLVPRMHEDVENSGCYSNALCICMTYLDIANGGSETWGR